MKKIILSLLIIAVTFGVTTAQNLNDPINNDPNVKIGKLKNGMTYYIRENKKPENRVEFRLAVNAGSNQEDEPQRGLAHFTEHMAFNGIKGYPGNTMISELQKIGVSFGGGINAYTSFDETVYMVTMPTEDPKNINFGLDILYGWACGLLYDADEIEAERGVIAEEYRMGLGASDRMMKKWFPAVFANSKYAERMPIGLIEVINGFEHKTIKSFYKDWYRPDLQAVIVVGCINAEEMEQQIIKKFSKIKPVKNPREKVVPALSQNEKPIVVVCTDKEAMGSTVLMAHKHPHFVMKTIGDFRKNLSYELYNIMYEARLQEMQQQPNCPFVGAAAGYSGFLGSTDAYASQAMANENKINETIEALLREDYRILQHGFLESELKRAKEDLLNQYETASKEVNKTESARFAGEYVNHYLKHDPIPGAKREYNLAKKQVETITLDEVNALAKQWITPENFAVVVMAPEKEGVIVPTEAEVLSIINDEKLKNVAPYVDTYKEQEIVYRENLTPGTITETRELPEVGAKELTLSNGIKVVLKKTDFKNDEILFAAKSKGGYSLYYECDIASAMFASDLVDRGGIAELDYASLMKKMKGKKVGIMPGIDVLSEALSGSTTPKDIDFFFQYLNAFFTNPRYDTAVYELVINETLQQTKMLKASPLYQYIAAFYKAVSQDDPYQMNAITMTEEQIKAADYERAFQIYKQRFANPADFTFFFVGNFDEKEMNDMLVTYVASLPTTTEKENFKGDVLKDFPAQKVDEDFFAGEEEQSYVSIAYNKDYSYSPKNNMIIAQIGEALQIELIETIREKMSGVYSPMLQMSSEKFPKANYSMMIMFSCAPDNTENLSQACFNILKEFSANGPKAETLAKVKEQMIREHQTNYQKNNTWLSYLSTKYFYDEADQLNAVNTFNDRVNEITNDDIVNFLKANFDVDHYVRMELYPEKMKK